MVPPTPLADTAAQEAALAEAHALGSALGSLPAILEPLARCEAVAFLARDGRHQAGVRTHPQGSALLAGVAAAGCDEAVDPARRALDRGLQAARVAARMGPGGATGLKEDRLPRLAAVDAALLAALGADLRAHPLRNQSMVALWKRLAELADRDELPAPGAAAPCPDDLTWRRLLRRVERLESDLRSLCGPGIWLYLGPEVLPAGFGALAAQALASPPADEGQADPPAPVTRAPEARPDSAVLGSLRPLITALGRLLVWCRRLAPRLTPGLRERLLLPV
ncbi:MAG: hypothetical protein ABIO70_34620 [Pseudomonadota bacterium]